MVATGTPQALVRDAEGNLLPASADHDGPRLAAGSVTVYGPDDQVLDDAGWRGYDHFSA